MNTPTPETDAEAWRPDGYGGLVVDADVCIRMEQQRDTARRLLREVVVAVRKCQLCDNGGDYLAVYDQMDSALADLEKGGEE